MAACIRERISTRPHTRTHIDMAAYANAYRHGRIRERISTWPHTRTRPHTRTHIAMAAYANAYRHGRPPATAVVNRRGRSGTRKVLQLYLLIRRPRGRGEVGQPRRAAEPAHPMVTPPPPPPAVGDTHMSNRCAPCVVVEVRHRGPQRRVHLSPPPAPPRPLRHTRAPTQEYGTCHAHRHAARTRQMHTGMRRGTTANSYWYLEHLSDEVATGRGWHSRRRVLIFARADALFQIMCGVTCGRRSRELFGFELVKALIINMGERGGGGRRRRRRGGAPVKGSCPHTAEYSMTPTAHTSRGVPSDARATSTCGTTHHITHNITSHHTTSHQNTLFNQTCAHLGRQERK